MLQLKRYKYNVHTGRFYKVTDPVTLPALVDMDSYCCEGCEAPMSVHSASPSYGDKENMRSTDSFMADGDYRKCGEVRREGWKSEGEWLEGGKRRWDRERVGKHISHYHG